MDGFRLGCATTLHPRMNIGMRFSWKTSDSLRASSNGTYPLESLDDRFNEPHVCRGGKLIVIAVKFDDGTSFQFAVVANQLSFKGRTEAATINQTAAMEAARLRMVSTVVTGFFRDMDRRLEEMKPKY